MTPNNFNHWQDSVGIVATIVSFATVVLIGLFIIGLSYAAYKIGVWRSPCTRVYNGDELIYTGNSYYYNTGSRGSSTIFKEYEPRFWFPKREKEIMSNDIRIETVSCQEI